MQNNYMHVGDKKHHEKAGLEEILEAFVLITLLGAIGCMIGIAGGVETDSLTLMQATKWFAAALIVLVIDVIIFSKVERDDESEFDRL